MQQANIINIITNNYEPQQKHRLGTVSKKITGGLKPVLQAPNLALSFYHGSKHTVVRSAFLGAHHLDSPISINGFTFIRKDRSETQGKCGGGQTYFRDNH